MVIPSGINRLIAESGVTDFKQISNIREAFENYDKEFDKEIKSIYEGARQNLVVNPSSNDVKQLFLGYHLEPSPSLLDSFIMFRIDKAFRRLVNKHAPIIYSAFNPLK